MKYAAKIFLLIGLMVRAGILVAQEDTTTFVYDEVTEAEIVWVNPESLPTTKAYKTETLTIRKFDAEKWKSVVGTTNFEEAQEEPQEKPQETPQGGLPWNSSILQIISYVAIFIIIGFIVYFIIQNASVGTKKTKNKPLVSDLAAPLEDIEAIDLNALLERALSGGDLRLVIRAHYLILLHTLHERGNIVWKKNKTNLDYLLELFTKNFYYEEIRDLTRAYETVWYGEQPLTTVTYEQLVTDFKKINQQLNSSKPE